MKVREQEFKGLRDLLRRVIRKVWVDAEGRVNIEATVHDLVPSSVSGALQGPVLHYR